MKRDSFVERREPRWRRLEAALESLEQAGRARRRLRRARPAEPAAAREALERLPELYRGVCQDLALARRRLYDAALIERLNRLALAGHHRLYRARVGTRGRTVDFLLRAFPAAVRAEARLVALAHLFFYGPFAAFVAAAWLAPEWVAAVLSDEAMAAMESMYDPSAATFGRASESDVAMFGMYVMNNIGIAFRTFATGIVFGLGSVFFLVFNGVYIGAVFGHLTRFGYGGTLHSFVVGHGAFELTAIVLSGAAGLRLGLALLRPGARTRARALREDARGALVIVAGAGAMLLVAAFVEAFWSSSGFPPRTKYLAGALLWAGVYAWLLLAGRARAPR